MFRRRTDAPALSPSSGNRDLPTVDGVAHPFTVVRNGYAMPEVAAFVGEISGDLGGMTPQDLRRVTFGIARRGYDKAEVIAYLNRVAAEVEAELEQAKRIARDQRIANRITPDPVAAPIVAAPGPGPAPAPAPAAPSVAEPVATAPESATTAARPEVTTWVAPAVEVSPAPTQPVMRWSQADVAALAEVVWLDEDGTATPAATPAPIAEEPEPAPVPELAPTPEPPVAAAPPADVLSATNEIADLLRAAHDNAVRLKTQAETDVRHTVETARAEVDAQKRSQERELAAARELVEREHARKRHEAELDATHIRQRAEQDAAAARAAAAAVLAQAKAEIEAVQALARHNLAEIEHAKQMSIEQARQMLSLGRSMIDTIIDLDHDAGKRLAASQAKVTALFGTDPA